MSHEQAILDFCAVTGASTDVAENYLQVADGNVETAVTLFLESGGQTGADSGLNTTTNVSSTRSSPRYRSQSDRDEHMLSDEELARQIEREEQSRNQVRAPIAPKRDILVGGDSPFDHGALWGSRERAIPRHSVFNQGDSSSGSPGPDFLRSLGDVGSSSSASSDSSNLNNVISAKARRLADLFRPPFDIMFRGGFEEARAVAREQKKWMLVNIQDPTEFSCQMLNRDLWSSDVVKEIVRESFIFLQYACESPEGKRYLTYYPINKYPHIAIIDSRTGERVKIWDKVVSPTDFMMDVTEFLEQHSPEVATSAAMKKPRMMKNLSDMSEEEQIKAAIAASLEAQGKSATDKDEAEQTSDMEEEHPESPSEEEMEAENILDSIKPVKREEPTDPSNSTRIQLRMADGRRIIRRFLKTDPVRYLFEFVKAEVPETQNRPFELVFNRKQLIESLDQPIHEAGLENAAVNFVFV